MQVVGRGERRVFGTWIDEVDVIPAMQPPPNPADQWGPIQERRSTIQKDVMRSAIRRGLSYRQYKEELEIALRNQGL